VLLIGVTESQGSFLLTISPKFDESQDRPAWDGERLNSGTSAQTRGN